MLNKRPATMPRPILTDVSRTDDAEPSRGGGHLAPLARARRTDNAAPCPARDHQGSAGAPASVSIEGSRRGDADSSRTRAAPPGQIEPEAGLQRGYLGAEP